MKMHWQLLLDVPWLQDPGGRIRRRRPPPPRRHFHLPIGARGRSSSIRDQGGGELRTDWLEDFHLLREGIRYVSVDEGKTV